MCFKNGIVGHYIKKINNLVSYLRCLQARMASADDSGSRGQCKAKTLFQLIRITFDKLFKHSFMLITLIHLSVRCNETRGITVLLTASKPLMMECIRTFLIRFA